MKLTKLADLYEREVDRHQALVQKLNTDLLLWGEFYKLFSRCADALRHGHKLVLFGNGGSAADAQHIAAELVVRYAKHRKPLAAIALTTDTSVLTAVGNDFGYADVFSRQVRAICQPGDVVIGITTSGESLNVLKALDAAKNDVGAWTAALTGMHYPKRLRDVSYVTLHVPSEDTPRIQEVHILLGHILCLALEEELCP
jgi:D-sedoheptulose 7-phosphate isomerase